MAHHSHSSANRFARSSDLANDRDNAEHCYHSASQQPTSSLPNKTTGLADSNARYVPASEHQAPLRAQVERVVREYFAALGDELPTDLYALILKEVELPLLTVTLEKTRGNQTKCAQILGLNRGTLRKKLKTYHLMS